MAGLPRDVVERAEAMGRHFEEADQRHRPTAEVVAAFHHLTSCPADPAARQGWLARLVGLWRQINHIED
ncbi:hypothetical protein PAPYR_8307 [Paratrimastix pyriformis]|uniref:Uncharacterized protein n=1 Tax=Paratrimastix pyriformis TaxID=342808 RepID=A0ABQ8UB12_9EUKA|nr:hypothetical protein PAPYR_8307 [Paratrimastix pyriformis]